LIIFSANLSADEILTGRSELVRSPAGSGDEGWFYYKKKISNEWKLEADLDSSSRENKRQTMFSLGGELKREKSFSALIHMGVSDGGLLLPQFHVEAETYKNLGYAFTGYISLAHLHYNSGNVEKVSFGSDWESESSIIIAGRITLTKTNFHLPHDKARGSSGMVKIFKTFSNEFQANLFASTGREEIPRGYPPRLELITFDSAGAGIAVPVNKSIKVLSDYTYQDYPDIHQNFQRISLGLAVEW